MTPMHLLRSVLPHAKRYPDDINIIKDSGRLIVMRPSAKPTVQLENDRVIVTEWRFEPGAETGWHRHVSTTTVFERPWLKFCFTRPCSTPRRKLSVLWPERSSVSLVSLIPIRSVPRPCHRPGRRLIHRNSQNVLQPVQGDQPDPLFLPLHVPHLSALMPSSILPD